MSRLPRILTVLGAVSAASLVPLTAVRAQIYGVHSGAVDLMTVDAAALGDTVKSSVGLFASNELTVAGGVGVLGGSLRAYVGSQPNRFGIPYVLGAGYARTLAAHDLLGPLHGVIGAELVGGFRHETNRPHEAGALNLTIPAGLSFGNPSGTSLGFYAAPYVESGLMRFWQSVPGPCTPYSGCDYQLSDTRLQSVAGVGLGGRAALGRFSLELLFRDVRWKGGRLLATGGESELGLTYRLGR